jgi:hypothetical protein
MIILYPLAVQLDYTELRFSLRSIEKYLKPPFEVVIVGQVLPAWINNVTQISLKDLPGRKQLNIRRKILAGLEYSEELFFMNDDIYLLNDTDPKSYPYYYSGTLNTIGETGARPLMNQLQAQNKPILHYDTHTPLLYEKEKFKALEIFTADCIIKSAYCNFHKIKGKEYPDLKINRKMEPNLLKDIIKTAQDYAAPCFSTGPQGLQSALPVLEELYPTKSKYEL